MSELLPHTTLEDPKAIYFPALVTSYTPSLFLIFPRATSGANTIRSPCSVKEMNGVYALCLADRIHLPPSPSLSITISQSLCGGIRKRVTHVWTASTPKNSPSTIVAKFYGPLYFRAEYDDTDPFHLAAWFAASEVRAYEKNLFKELVLLGASASM